MIRAFNFDYRVKVYHTAFTPVKPYLPRVSDGYPQHYQCYQREQFKV